MENDEVLDDDEAFNEALDGGAVLCVRCGAILVRQSSGKQVCPTGCRVPSESESRRLSLRVVGRDLQWWRQIAEIEKRSLSAMIRYVVNQHVNKSEFAVGPLVPANSGRTKYWKIYNETIVLRVPTFDLERWTLAARMEHRTVSDMIRRVVTSHVQSWLNEINQLKAEEDAKHAAEAAAAGEEER